MWRGVGGRNHRKWRRRKRNAQGGGTKTRLLVSGVMQLYCMIVAQLIVCDDVAFGDSIDSIDSIGAIGTNGRPGRETRRPRRLRRRRSKPLKLIHPKFSAPSRKRKSSNEPLPVEPVNSIVIFHSIICHQLVVLRSLPLQRVELGAGRPKFTARFVGPTDNVIWQRCLRLAPRGLRGPNNRPAPEETIGGLVSLLLWLVLLLLLETNLKCPEVSLAGAARRSDRRHYVNQVVRLKAPNGSRGREYRVVSWPRLKLAYVTVAAIKSFAKIELDTRQWRCCCRVYHNFLFFANRIITERTATTISRASVTKASGQPLVRLWPLLSETKRVTSCDSATLQTYGPGDKVPSAQHKWLGDEASIALAVVALNSVARCTGRDRKWHVAAEGGEKQRATKLSSSTRRRQRRLHLGSSSSGVIIIARRRRPNCVIANQKQIRRQQNGESAAATMQMPVVVVCLPAKVYEHRQRQEGGAQVSGVSSIFVPVSGGGCPTHCDENGTGERTTPSQRGHRLHNVMLRRQPPTASIDLTTEAPEEAAVAAARVERRDKLVIWRQFGGSLVGLIRARGNSIANDRQAETENDRRAVYLWSGDSGAGANRRDDNLSNERPAETREVAAARKTTPANERPEFSRVRRLKLITPVVCGRRNVVGGSLVSLTWLVARKEQRIEVSAWESGSKFSSNGGGGGSSSGNEDGKQVDERRQDEQPKLGAVIVHLATGSRSVEFASASSSSPITGDLASKVRLKFRQILHDVLLSARPVGLAAATKPATGHAHSGPTNRNPVKDSPRLSPRSDQIPRRYATQCKCISNDHRDTQSGFQGRGHFAALQPMARGMQIGARKSDLRYSCASGITITATRTTITKNTTTKTKWIAELEPRATATCLRRWPALGASGYDYICRTDCNQPIATMEPDDQRRRRRTFALASRGANDKVNLTCQCNTQMALRNQAPSAGFAVVVVSVEQMTAPSSRINTSLVGQSLVESPVSAVFVSDDCDCYCYDSHCHRPLTLASDEIWLGRLSLLPPPPPLSRNFNLRFISALDGDNHDSELTATRPIKSAASSMAKFGPIVLMRRRRPHHSRPLNVGSNNKRERAYRVRCCHYSGRSADDSDYYYCDYYYDYYYATPTALLAPTNKEAGDMQTSAPLAGQSVGRGGAEWRRPERRTSGCSAATTDRSAHRHDNSASSNFGAEPVRRAELVKQQPQQQQQPELEQLKLITDRNAQRLKFHDCQAHCSCAGCPRLKAGLCRCTDPTRPFALEVGVVLWFVLSYLCAWLSKLINGETLVDENGKQPKRRSRSAGSQVKWSKSLARAMCYCCLIMITTGEISPAAHFLLPVSGTQPAISPTLSSEWPSIIELSGGDAGIIREQNLEAGGHILSLANGRQFRAKSHPLARKSSKGDNEETSPSNSRGSSSSRRSNNNGQRDNNNNNNNKHDNNELRHHNKRRMGEPRKHNLSSRSQPWLAGSAKTRRSAELASNKSSEPLEVEPNLSHFYGHPRQLRLDDSEQLSSVSFERPSKSLQFASGLNPEQDDRESRRLGHRGGAKRFDKINGMDDQMDNSNNIEGTLKSLPDVAPSAQSSSAESSASFLHQTTFALEVAGEQGGRFVRHRHCRRHRRQHTSGRPAATGSGTEKRATTNDVNRIAGDGNVTSRLGESSASHSGHDQELVSWPLSFVGRRRHKRNFNGRHVVDDHVDDDDDIVATTFGSRAEDRWLPVASKQRQDRPPTIGHQSRGVARRSLAASSVGGQQQQRPANRKWGYGRGGGAGGRSSLLSAAAAAAAMITTDEQDQHQDRGDSDLENNHQLISASSLLPPLGSMSNSISSSASSIGQKCPRECSCTWKNGKQFADCSRQQHPQQPLVRVPQGLDPLLQVLNLTSNQLRDLPESVFHGLDLNNLQRIYLSHNQMETINRRAFESLKLVVELDFSWNRLRSVPLAQIKHLSLLRRLSMRGNHLFALIESTFAGEGLNVSSAETSDEEAPSSQQKLAKEQMGRLYETYPELANGLVRDDLISSGADLQDEGSIIGRGFFSLQVEDTQQQLENLQAIALRTIVSQMQEQDAQNNQLDHPLDLEAAPNDLQATENTQNNDHLLLGSYFGQLQELDFGHCSLRYIKWTTMRKLSQLKRLLLDGNHLSQLSGKLLATLPIGLHQLSLEDNQWKCDCRLAPLKRWLQSTRTPLSAPVRCHHMSSSSSSSSPSQSQSSAMRSSLGAGASALPLAGGGGAATFNFRPANRRAKRRAMDFAATSARGHHHADCSGHHHGQLAGGGSDLAAAELGRIFASKRGEKPTERGSTKRITPRARQSRQTVASDEPLSGNLSPDLQRPASDQMDMATLGETNIYLDQLDLEEFVCSPRAIKLNGSSLLLSASPSQSAATSSSSLSSTGANLDQKTRLQSHKEAAGQQAELQQRLNLSLIYEYLEPSLVEISFAAGAKLAASASNSDSRLNDQSASRVQVPAIGHKGSSWLIGGAGNSNHQTHRDSAALDTNHIRREFIKTNEGDKVTLRCSFLVYPESSLDIIWLADYNPNNRLHLEAASGIASENTGETQRPPTTPQISALGRLPAEERFVVLYDSKLHRVAGSQQSASSNRAAHQINGNRLPEAPSFSSSSSETDDGGGEQANGREHVARPSGATSDSVDVTSVQGTRLVIRETRASQPMESILKESQIIIQETQVADSARYKCIGLNRAGNQSAEFIVRVQRKSQVPSDWSPDRGTHLAPSGSRDQRANTGSGNAASPTKSQQEQQTRALASQVLNVNEQRTQTFRHIPQQSASSQWLKGSFTFQFVMVFVSVLMAGVIVAFVVFCIAIYRIKPSGNLSNMRNQANGYDPSSGQPITPTPTTTNTNYWPLLPLPFRKASILMGLSSPVAMGQRSPSVLTAVCDPITGQTPVHLLTSAPANASHHLELNQMTNGVHLNQLPNGVSQRQQAQYFIQQSNHIEESGFANWPNGINGTYRTSPVLGPVHQRANSNQVNQSTVHQNTPQQHQLQQQLPQANHINQPNNRMY